jgi:hypothetical protein
VLEALTGERSFPGTLMESVTARLLNDPRIPDTLDPGWRDLLARMTAREPADRPTALEVALAARSIELDDRGPATAGPADSALLGRGLRPAEATAVLPVVRPPSVEATPAPAPSPAPGRARGRTSPQASGGADGSDAPASRAASRRRTATVVVVALLLVVAAALLVRLVAPGADAPPTLPEVEEPLGTHLDDLLQSVTS